MDGPNDGVDGGLTASDAGTDRACTFGWTFVVRVLTQPLPVSSAHSRREGSTPLRSAANCSAIHIISGQSEQLLSLELSTSDDEFLYTAKVFCFM